MPTSTPSSRAALDLAVVGAGPVGLGLALHAARTLPDTRITLYDARGLDADIGRDPRTLALALGSVQWLERLDAWDASAAQPILEVHVSQAPPSWAPSWPGGPASEPALRLTAAETGVPMLGAVLSHGRIVAPMQAAWLAAAAREPQRLVTRFGAPVAALKALPGGVEVDAGIVERHDLTVVAEGGVYGGATHRALAPHGRPPLAHDYRQVAWVGQVRLDGAPSAVAFERFTRSGPVALLPLKADGGLPRAALVWCVAAGDDPVDTLSDAQRATVLNTLLPRAAGRVVEVSPLKRFPLGLVAERTLVDGRTVRIGNAAQTLHPVAGQGLNLGLRDAHALVAALGRALDTGAGGGQAAGALDAALRRVEWQRAPDRWALIAATDFLARSFTWRLPGLGAARGAALAALQALGPAKSLLARQMMFGRR